MDSGLLPLLGRDCCNQDIYPFSISTLLLVRKSSRVDYSLPGWVRDSLDGSLWGCVDGCSMVIYWSDKFGSNFTYIDAKNLVKSWNNKLIGDVLSSMGEI